MRQSPPHPLPWRETASPPIPDELLLEIFRRIPSPTNLVRTSATCVTFRRLIADRSFLRQYRKLHAPPLLGFLGYRVFHPAEPPHPSAPAAKAVAAAVDFTFSFLPAPAPSHRWDVRDICEGRVLLEGTALVNFNAVIFREMVVCDPLHRQYVLIPPIPDDLAGTVEYPIRPFCESFLVPHYGDEAAMSDETSFRVVWMMECLAKLVAFVFSSGTRQWRAISRCWTNLFAGLPSFAGNPLFSHRQYACGCFYWLPIWKYELKMLVLDTLTMEFSIAEPPSEAKKTSYLCITMLESREGRPRMLVSGPGISSRSYTIWRKNGGSSSQWQKEKIISLSLISGKMLRCSVGKYLVLDHHGSSSLEPGLCTRDIETLQVKRVCASVYGYAYSNYPPSLSSPKVSSGTQEDDEKDMLEQGAETLQAEEPTGSPHGESTTNDGNAGGQASVSRTGDDAD